MSVISKLTMLGAAGSGGESYWILKYKPAAGVTGGAVYCMSPVSSNGTDEGTMFWLHSDSGQGQYITKIDKDGNVSGSIRIPSDYWGGLLVDSSENVYLANSIYSGGYKANVAKFNSNLILQSSTNYTTTVNGFVTPNAFHMYNDDIYWSYNYSDFYPGQRPTGFIIDGATMSLTGGQYSYASIDDSSIRSLKVDSSGNIFTHSNYRSSGGSDQAKLYKFGTNFSSVTWMQEISGTGSYGQDIDFDSSGNIYTCGFTNTGYPNVQDNYLAKFNSSGTNQWTSCLYLGGNPSAGSGFDGGDGTLTNISIGVNSSGVYTVTLAKNNVASNFNEYNITKWNQSTGAFVESYGIACVTTAPGWKDATNRYNTHCMVTETAIYIPGRDQSNYFYMMKLPLENASSVYGTYTLDGVSFTIGANSASAGTISQTWSAGSTGSTTSRSFSTASRTISPASASYSTQFTDI